MAKSKILTPSNFSSVDTPIIGTPKPVSSVPKVVGVKPCGTQILVEVLTQQELSGTTLELAKNTKLEVTPQGYIRAVGPAFKADDWGFKVGDRVVFSGTGVMAPSYDNSPRDRFFMDPYVVKSVLIEE